MSVPAFLAGRRGLLDIINIYNQPTRFERGQTVRQRMWPIEGPLAVITKMNVDGGFDFSYIDVGCSEQLKSYAMFMRPMQGTVAVNAVIGWEVVAPPSSPPNYPPI